VPATDWPASQSGYGHATDNRQRRDKFQPPRRR